MSPDESCEQIIYREKSLVPDSNTLNNRKDNNSIPFSKLEVDHVFVTFTF